MLETSERVRCRGRASSGDTIVTDSLYNLRSVSCVLEFEHRRLVSANTREPLPPGQPAATESARP